MEEGSRKSNILIKNSTTVCSNRKFVVDKKCFLNDERHVRAVWKKFSSNSTFLCILTSMMLLLVLVVLLLNVDITESFHVQDIVVQVTSPCHHHHPHRRRRRRQEGMADLLFSTMYNHHNERSNQQRTLTRIQVVPILQSPLVVRRRSFITSTSKTTSQCNLFYKSNHEEQQYQDVSTTKNKIMTSSSSSSSSSSTTTTTTTKRQKIPPHIFDKLSSRDIILPVLVTLEVGLSTSANGLTTTTNNNNNNNNNNLYVDNETNNKRIDMSSTDNNNNNDNSNNDNSNNNNSNKIDGNDSIQTPYPTTFEQAKQILTVRTVRMKDIQRIGTICVQEYGTNYYTSDHFPIHSINTLLGHWLDRVALRFLVQISTALKVVSPMVQCKKPNKNDTNSTTTTTSNNNNKNNNNKNDNSNNMIETLDIIPDDHAVIVLTMRSIVNKEMTNVNTNTNYDVGNDNIDSNNNYNNEVIIGMVEVSRQPVIPDRNPEPFPIPLVWKQMYCNWNNYWTTVLSFLTSATATTATTSSSTSTTSSSSNNKNKNKLQGWITNLLIVPEHRGKGYSKLLIKACEGIARLWNCNTIHLHCDASTDSTDAKIAQQLYRSMGYTIGNNHDHSTFYHHHHRSTSSCSNSNSNSNKGGTNLFGYKYDNDNTNDDTSGDWSWMMKTTGSDTNNEQHVSYFNSDVVFVQGVPLLYLEKQL